MRAMLKFSGSVTRVLQPVLLSLVFATVVFSQATAPSIHHGSVERIKVHGTSLEGNLEGDSADRDVSVYLPPSYHVGGQQRYPTLYLLHGFTDNDSVWFGDTHKFINATAAADRAFSSGTREMILVMPNAHTRYFGAMYSNSVTTGNWEDFVAHDLVAYIDAHYRTISNPTNRGLAGHSMGGYGAIRLAMKHPEVFSSIYALSACCLAPFPNPETRTKAKLEEIHTDEDLAKADFFAKANFASAAAWSPNPKNPPRYLDLPGSSDTQPSVADRWAANAPTVMIHQYVPSLKSLRAIAFDVGSQDFLAASVQTLDAIFTTYKIPHTYETYDGDHLNRIELRLEKKVLPFFATNLGF
jgi:S-formylglutathione hydrolase